MEVMRCALCIITHRGAQQIDARKSIDCRRGISTAEHSPHSGYVRRPFGHVTLAGDAASRAPPVLLPNSQRFPIRAADRFGVFFAADVGASQTDDAVRS